VGLPLWVQLAGDSHCCMAEWLGAGVVICLERGADCHCHSLSLASVKRVCVCVGGCGCVCTAAWPALHSAATASSVTLSAEIGSRKQTRYLCCRLAKVMF